MGEVLVYWFGLVDEVNLLADWFRKVPAGIVCVCVCVCVCVVEYEWGRT